VLITGLTEIQDRVDGIEAGADDFLSKPVEKAQLIARVRSLLRQKAYTDELERAESVLFALAMSIEGKDPYTEGHCQRLAENSARLGEVLGLAGPQIIALRRAGLVHDIGKVAVPDSILLKPGRLTPSEKKIMQRHPLVGERICSPLKSFQLVLPIIRHHHEKMDGTGYPDKLKGEEIPLTARILQVVDVFDALTTSRPYKSALTVDEALAVMKKEVKKGWWDLKVFAAFDGLIEKDVQKFISMVKAAAAAGN
jgi:putative two-component system response regulator